MNGQMKVVLAVTVLCVGTCAFAGRHHHRHRNEGLELANGIVDLVCRVLKPAPVVVAPQPAAVVTPAPVVVAPQPATVVTPAPVVVAPQPVYYTQPRTVYYTRPVPPPRPRHHKGHRRR